MYRPAPQLKRPNKVALSLIAVFLAMVSFDYQITLKNVYGAPAFLAGLAATFAATGLFSQAFLGLSRAKDRWLAARFGAERLRCFKFQLFTVLEEVPDAQSLASKVKQRTSGISAGSRPTRPLPLLEIFHAKKRVASGMAVWLNIRK